MLPRALLIKTARRLSTVCLRDTFNRQHTYLRISIAEKCNLRCQYCMPPEGVDLTPRLSLLTTSEILYLGGVFADLGVTKIRLTGGEPLVNKDIVNIVGGLKSIPGIESVSLTTNGVTLYRHLPQLLDAGLDNVNVSLDTFVPQKFSFLTRRHANLHKKVLISIDDAVNSRLKSIKLNVVVMKGINDDEILDFVNFTKDVDISVRFLEFMPFNGNSWNWQKFLPYLEQKNIIENTFGKLTPVVDSAHSTSKNFTVPGHVGTVGFISSITKNFCGGCNRLRLTHDGNLKVCLFGKDEVSLRDVIRSTDSKDEVHDAIARAVKAKAYSHGGVEEIKKGFRRPMILIGG